MDIAAYRRAETLAKQNLTSWRAAQAHYPVTFAALGFPIQVESTADLLQLTDMFQEGRADAYQAECGGLRPADFDAVCAALADWCRFAAQTWHLDRVVLPLDTMLSSWALYGKLRKWKDDFHSLLEIGPGCGYSSFFLENHQELDLYSQIEATESLYILQYLVNYWCFAAEANDHAPIWRARQDGILVDAMRQPRCMHAPWWANLKPVQCDLITSNANLREFSPAALQQYAKLIGDTLAPDGALIVQCLGDGALTRGQVFDALERNGLALAYATGPGVDTRKMAVGNYIWTRKGLDGATERAAKVYAMRPGGRVYTRAEFEARIGEMLT